MKPGDSINRRQIATECEVSVAPVAEAMLKLEHEGFLRTVARKGTFVRFYTRDEIVGHLILKEAIECAAAEHYGKTEILANYEELFALASKLDNWNGEKMMDKWSMDLDFHKALVSLAGYSTLVDEFSRIAVPNVFCHVHQMMLNYGKLSHVQLLNDLMNDDRAAAIQCLRAHLRSGKRM